LLYAPFTPFFIIFGHIVRSSDPNSSLQRDLDLLASTVAYFASMRSQTSLLVRVTARLEKTAEVFFQLARCHIEKVQAAQVGDLRMESDTRLFPSRKSQQPSDHEMSNLPGTTTVATMTTTPSLSIPDGDPAFEPTFDDIDIDSFLSWLPMDLEMDSLSAIEIQPSGQGSVADGPRGRKRTIESTFDWFSWDSHYSNA